MNHIETSNLPRTGYIVRLVLWALFQKQSERLNEALLLTNVIDFLLGKADFTQSLQRDFDPKSKEITLQHLSMLLHKNNGILSRNAVLSELISFFEKKALQCNADDVLNKLIECGILVADDTTIKFKYRCFEEYFIASLLSEDADEWKLVMTGDKFVDFDREIELLVT